MKTIISIFFLFSLMNAFSVERTDGNSNKRKNPDDDSISVASIPSNFFLVNQPVEISVLGQSVKFGAKGKTDLLNFADGTYNINTAPMLLFYPDSDFVLTAHIDIQCTGNYSGGALMVYSDENNWAKLLFEHSPSGEYAIWTGVTDQITDDNKNAVINQKVVYLRIAKKRILYCFYYSMDGENWTLIRSFGQPNIKPVSIGFLVQAPEEDSCAIPFSEISYKGTGFNDFWSGN